MLKWVATTILNRLVFLTVLLFAINALTRTSCGAGDDPVSQIGKAISSIHQLADAFQRR
ncbi:MAG: hypothetical protein ACLP1D_13980 [Xanthobacteraceae bacterium]